MAIADGTVERRPNGRGYLADPLQRAAISVALNIVEGAGELFPPEKVRFYRMAMRSAAECQFQKFWRGQFE